MSDNINAPKHYRSNIDGLEAFGLGFALGNAIKYILRAGKKGERSEDLKKARWYLSREIGGEWTRDYLTGAPTQPAPPPQTAPRHPTAPSSATDAPSSRLLTRAEVLRLSRLATKRARR